MPCQRSAVANDRYEQQKSVENNHKVILSVQQRKIMHITKHSPFSPSEYTVHGKAIELRKC